ncbi:hypothetical protein MAR_011514 [Mya arenaria]|uniref:CUB domain-containing protein n=1 Tax=Mya arenaria TaxID=6604 RepID=A0ABY7FU99_MYAAR|nr:hypothetical protein MAR_011514 [Mya arenaria]
METSNCCDVLLCYLCAHILLLLCFSRVFVNGDQAIYVTNDTCGKEISFASTDVIHFHYDGSKWYDEGGHHFRRCEIKISNKHKDTELCIASPYSRYTMEWVGKCTARFQFRFYYYALPCFGYTNKGNCQNSEEALAVFFYPVVFKEGDFEIKIYTRYRGQNVGTDGLSLEPFQVDMPVIPRSNSPPPYDSLIVNGMDTYGAQQRDPSIPPYLSATDSNTNHPSAPPLISEQPQIRAWHCSPQLPTASPHSGEPPQNGAYNVQYSVEESEDRHTHRTPGFSTSNNNETSQTPPHAETDLSELPPPPSYEMVVSADSPYLTSDSDYHTDTCINDVSSHYS